jgi:hypothetical protein
MRRAELRGLTPPAQVVLSASSLSRIALLGHFRHVPEQNAAVSVRRQRLAIGTENRPEAIGVWPSVFSQRTVVWFSRFCCTSNRNSLRSSPRQLRAASFLPSGDKWRLVNRLFARRADTQDYIGFPADRQPVRTELRYLPPAAERNDGRILRPLGELQDSRTIDTRGQLLHAPSGTETFASRDVHGQR